MIIDAQLPLETLASWAGASAPPAALQMLRDRLVHFHAGEQWESLADDVRLSHLEVIELAYSQGARPGRP